MTPETIVQKIKEAGGLSPQIEILMGLTDEQLSQVVAHLNIKVELSAPKNTVWAKILQTIRTWPKGIPEYN